MKNTPRILVVDGNWYLHRAWFTLRTRRDYAIALPYSVVGMVTKDACKVKATHILVAFDGDKVFRKALFPEYKSSRNKEAKLKDSYENEDDGTEGGVDIYEFLPATRRYLESMGISWVQKSKYEADDVLASAAAQFKLPVVLGAQDKDLYQVLSDNVQMYDSSAKPEPKRITVASVEKKRRLKISQLISFQTLIGDGIDDIKPFKKEGEARAILSKYGSIKNWAAKGGKEAKIWVALNKTGLLLNKKLVTLITDIDLPSLDNLVVPKLVRDDAPRAWYEYQNFLYPRSRGLFK